MAVSSDVYDRISELYHVKDTRGVAKLVLAGAAFFADNDTRAKVIGHGSFGVRVVRLEDGEMQVRSEFVVKELIR